jgi:hypothetical protein
MCSNSKSKLSQASSLIWSYDLVVKEFFDLKEVWAQFHLLISTYS